METVTLASTSPQRREILQRLGIPFRVLSVPINEDLDSHTDPAELVQSLARNKVEAVRKAYRLAGNWIIGADTLILSEGKKIGKPRDRDDAAEILHGLSGRAHAVFTGTALAVAGSREIVTRVDATTVHMASLSDDDIEWYLSTEEWQGAAGAYRIQVRGACLVEKIEGSHTNVVGLPIRTIYGMLKTYNYQLSN